ncbi:DegT/DnrJ/EryC1/StrS family aminotransferase [Halorientalis pallida]|uniref:DegT/DnrJ/EryC1/StrS family aminotransferase n=1 Tax=Halorientalis pallida TaxID=2479928 RepID=A0A498KS91_9EURY|nr:DegT/DnrJ/EryC1/StrS family aminotransferase [Halorientalis pallida]RXK47437.1 DegT/DnrJ/EryC1/StrS family aminotransferase [Halorientalis pallida]
MTIPIANPQVSEAAKEAVCDVLDSGMLADGEVVREFESAFADYVGVEHAVATSSGTTALHAMFEAAGVGEDDVVLTTPFSFISTANAVKHAGAEVTFTDVRLDTCNLDPTAVRETLAERDDVTALMPVHLYGLPADMEEFREIAREHDLLLFEDAAQAHGASYNGEMVGSIGDAGAFSFYPTKNMTTGEGGMITTDDEALAERARRLIDHGRVSGYEHAEIGYNFRMTNIQAAIGRDQIDRLPDWIDRRRENAARLTGELAGIDDVETPTIPADRTHAFHQYTIRTEHRERIQAALDAASIGYAVYYPVPIPAQPAYDQLGEYPVASDLSERVLSLPVHPQVTAEDVDAIAGAVQRAEVNEA